MSKTKQHHVNTRIDDSLKIRVMAYARRHKCSESECVRLALKKFLQTNVEKAKQILQKEEKASPEV